MEFTLTRATVSLALVPASHIPSYRQNFNPETHRLFDSYVAGFHCKIRHPASVCIPKALLGSIPLEDPIRTRGLVILHLVDERTLEFQIDVEYVCGGAKPILIGQLLVDLRSEAGSSAFSPESREAWLIDQLSPIKRQFWLNRPPVDAISDSGTYRWFRLQGHWDTAKTFFHVSSLPPTATFYFTGCLLPQTPTNIVIGDRSLSGSRRLTTFPSRLLADRKPDTVPALSPSPSNPPVMLADPSRTTGAFPGPSTTSNSVHENTEVEAKLSTAQDQIDADPVIALAIPQPPLQQHAPRRRPAPRRSTNRQALDLRQEGRKLERALKQLGAEHMLQHVVALFSATRPGAMTRSKLRAHAQFFAGPLVGTRAQRRQLAAAA